MKRSLAFTGFILCVAILGVSAQIGTWYPQNVPPGHQTLLDIDMFDTQWGAAVGYPNFALNLSGIVLTYDGGVRWNPIPTDMFDPPLPDWTVWRAVSMPDPFTIWVAGDSALCYVSFDGGATWTRDTITTKGTPTIRDLHFITWNEGYAVGGDSYILPPHPVPPQIPTGPVIFARKPGFRNWIDESPSPNLLPGGPALYAVDYAGGTWAVCGESSETMVRTGAGWVRTAQSSTVMFDVLKDITVINPQEMVISGETFGVGRGRALVTLDGANRWLSFAPISVPTGVTDFPSNHFFTSRYGWIGSSQDYLAVTTNGGVSWTRFQVASAFATGPLKKMDFVDSLNGWAVGGDTLAGIRSAWIIRYSGYPPKPDISLTQTSAVFPEIRCERFAEATVTIRNSGTGELVINNGQILFSSTEYSVQGVTFPIRIQPGKGKQVTIRWTPDRTTVGVVSGIMSIYSNDPDHNPWKITLESKRTYGVVEIPAEIEILPGACVNDSTSLTIFGFSKGTLPPTVLGFEYISGQNEFRLVSPKPGTVISGSMPFLFRFTPKQSGVREALYRFISGNPACPDTLLMRLRSVGEFVRIVSNTTEIDFGKLCINTVRDTVITLRNTGNTYAMIEKMELTSGQDLFPALTILPTFLMPDSSMAFRIRFAPQFTGTYTSVYRIVSGFCPDTLLLTMKGEAISTEITFTPRGGIAIGPTIVGKPVFRTVIVRNTGKTAANITMLALKPPHKDLELKNVPPLPMTLLPGMSFDVAIHFTPTMVETIETQLIAAWSEVCTDTARLDVTAPCLPNPHIVAMDAIDVGLQECPPPIRVTKWIKNIGNGPLVFFGTSLSGPNASHFRVISPTPSDTVRPRDSVRLVVEYNRDTEGSSTATLFLSHNDTERMPTQIALTGRRKVMEFVVTGDSTTEFFTRLFVPQNRTFRITNPGVQPVTISAIEVVKGSTVFSVQPSVSLPATIPPGGFVSFEVVFMPDGRGPFQASIRLTSTPCNTTAVLTLTGRGDTEGLSVDRGSIDYALDPCSFSALCDTVYLGNQGSEAVTVLGLSISQTVPVFTISSSPATPFTIDAGKERGIVVCADPSYFGSYAALLEILSNDPMYPRLTVSLRSNRDSSNIAVSVTAIDFGRLTHCSTSFSSNITVTNTGQLPEIVSTALANGSNGFTSTGGTGITLLPGRSFSFSVNFDHPAFGVFTDTLVVSTERCPTPILVPISGEWVEQRYAAAPRPLVFPSVNVGSSSIRSVSVQNAGGFDAHIAAVTVTPPGEYTVVPGYPSVIQAGHSESIPFRFSPAQEGARNAVACVVFDSPCRDTLCVDLTGTGVRGRLVLSSVSLAFGTLAQCEVRDLEDTLFNTGSGPVTLLSAALSGTNAASFSLLTPIASAETLPPGGSRIFRLRHTASLVPLDGMVTALLSIVTDDPLQNLVDLPLEATRVTLIPSPGEVLSFGTVERGRPVQRTVMLYNRGSARLCYRSEKKPADIAYTPPLPFCIEPGDSTALTVTYTPSTVGTTAGTLALFTADPCIDSTLIQYDAQVQQGTISLATSYNYGVSAYCEQRMASLQTANSYLVDATLDSIRLSGPDAAFFTVTVPNTFPRVIPAGGNAIIRVVFQGENRRRNYDAVMRTYFTVFGQPLSLTTQLTAETDMIALSGGPIALGTAFVGQSPSQSVWTFRNETVFPLGITSITTSDPDVTVISTTPTVPCLLQHGDSIAVSLSFHPSRPGAYSVSLLVASDTPCPAEMLSIPMTGTAIQQQTVTTALSVGTLSGAPDQKILIPVLTDKNLGTSSVTSWQGSLSFNRSMLYPLRAVKEGTASADMSVSMHYVSDSGRVYISASGAPLRSGPGPLVYVECLVLIGDDTQTPIRISPDFDFTSGFAQVVQRSDGIFTLEGWCYSNGRLIRDLGINTLFQNRPNPVSLALSPRTTIAFSLAADAVGELTLHDATGRRVMVLAGGAFSKGMHEITVDLANLPAGAYYYTLTTDTFRATRPLLLAR
ncbi:MAG: choice-of-anchor D domain-containing protein [Bacteroidota bacterium]|nr:choice-of-anchor D domain-containing protein [Bacteroidota bacterium]